MLDDISVHGATGVLINIVGGADMRMKEIQEAASLIQEQAHEDANIIFGASIDENMAEALKVTVIATGFERKEREIGVEAQAVKASSRPMARESIAPISSTRPEAAPAYAKRGSAPALEFRGSEGPAVRERVSFPSQLDTDWDVPAFQRRQSGS